MRKRNQARADYDDLLFVKWRDGFEEIYDYDDDPHLYDGSVNTLHQQQNADMLRERLLAMRTAAGEQYRALETG
jgi:hypothetical protein